MKKQTYLLLAACCVSLSVWAQQPLQHEKGTYTDEQNRYYQHPSLPVFLFIGTSPEGNALPMRKEKSNRADAIYLDGHGVHYIRHPVTRGKNKGSEIRYTIYADGLAPTSSAAFTGAPKFVGRSQVFFGKGLNVQLSAQDEMSGLQEIYRSADGESYAPYQNSIPFDREGEHALRYYALDHVGNAEKPQEKRFVVDLTTPESEYMVKGDRHEDIISPRTTVSLSASDALSGVQQILYKTDNEEVFKPYRGTLNFAFFADGEHTHTFKAIDQVKNEEAEQNFTFYLDKTPPIVSSEVIGDRFVAGGKTYFAGRTKLKLTAMDNKSGVKAIYYAIDGGEYRLYEEPFYIPSQRGDHVVNYYAVDQVNNKGSGSYTRSVSSMYMDLTGPTLSRTFSGSTFVTRDTVFVSERTQIVLNARDAESGVQYITYTLPSSGEEMTYNSPFTLQGEGVHTLEFFGYDNVNNMNRSSFTVKVDNTGPEIFTHFSIKPLTSRILSGSAPTQSAGSSGEVAVFSKHVSLFVAATDAHTGTDKVFYSLNGGPELPYLQTLQAFAPGKLHRLRVRATDKLGNQTVKEMMFQLEK
jgi:hypothetical protein